MNKRGFEFSFAWLFAVVVGAVIIFLAIYAATNLIETNRYETDTRIAAQLESVLSPVGTNLEESKYVKIVFPDETRIFNRCSNVGTFGNQLISTSVRSGLGKEWMAPGAEIESKDKYVFSESIVQTKEANVFVKSFNLPYKVSDLIIIYSGEYCFVNPPGYVEDEILGLNLPGINITDNLADCKKDTKRVCFSSFDRNCDLLVEEEEVEGLYYFDDLIYPAIFSEKEVYECQLRRLMKRTAELAELYAKKSEFLSAQGCSSNLESELAIYSNLLKDYEGSQNLGFIEQKSKEIEDINERLICKLF